MSDNTDIGTIEREYPNATALQKTIYHLQGLWDDYRIWDDVATKEGHIKLFGTPKDIDLAGKAYVKSVQAQFRVVDGFNLRNALERGDITQADIDMYEQVKSEYNHIAKNKYNDERANELKNIRQVQGDHDRER